MLRLVKHKMKHQECNRGLFIPFSSQYMTLVTSTEDTNSTVKLFGVPFSGKKILHSEELKFGVSY